MKIVCATSVWRGEEIFGILGDVVMVPEEAISRAVLKDADALVIRSKTKITPELLEDTTISFVGTATTGTDHMNLAYLEDRGIAWAASAGCNANSVSEYIVSALLCLVQRHGLVLANLSLGIVGVGHVGSAVAEKARGPARRLCSFEVEAGDADVWGDEPIWFDGEVVGFVTSGGYAHYIDRSIALGFLPVALIGRTPQVEIEILGERRRARMLAEPPLDPRGTRMRGRG